MTFKSTHTLTQTPGRTPKSSTRVLNREVVMTPNRIPPPSPFSIQALSHIAHLIIESGTHGLGVDAVQDETVKHGQVKPLQEKSELEIISEMLQNSDFFRKAGWCDIRVFYAICVAFGIVLFCTLLCGLAITWTVSYLIKFNANFYHT